MTNEKGIQNNKNYFPCGYRLPNGICGSPHPPRQSFPYCPYKENQTKECSKRVNLDEKMLRVIAG